MSYRPVDTKQRILHRLKITRGHLDTVIKMIENDRYCIDVLHQVQAVEKALVSTSHVILENHLNTCVADAIQNGEKERVVSEVMEVFKKKKL